MAFLRSMVIEIIKHKSMKLYDVCTWNDFKKKKKKVVAIPFKKCHSMLKRESKSLSSNKQYPVPSNEMIKWVAVLP